VILLKGFTISLIKATAAAFRNESAEDITMEITPAITIPLSPIGITVLITNGMGRFGSRSGFIANATIPIKPVIAKNGKENTPLHNVPLAVCFDSLERKSLCTYGGTRVFPKTKDRKRTESCKKVLPVPRKEKCVVGTALLTAAQCRLLDRSFRDNRS
jgi:hypothetical protein